MTDKKYKLTISIMASNRKDTLPKTLESIKPILDNVSSELIITDTGCDDELLDVIRTYTDKIVKFQWCNDFAKARNVGLKMAQGEWFMFVDDDEWFEDVGEIVEFFNSEECKKYNLFHYIQRNYSDAEGSTWMDSPVERGIRIDEETEFEGSIHEHFSKMKMPIKLFKSYVHHYGYVYKTDEDRKKHFMRNATLLLENIEKEPHVVRNYTHMIKAYNAQPELDKSLELAWKALKNVDRAREENRRDVSVLYANIVYCEFYLNRLEDAINHGEEFLEKEELTEMGKCMIYALLTNSYLIKRDNEKAMSSVKRYFELYEYLENNLEIKMCQITAVVSNAISWNMLNRMWFFSLRKAVDMEDEHMVLYIMDKIKYLTKVEAINGNNWQGKLITMMKESEHKEQYVDTVLTFMEEVESATVMCGEILKLKDEDEKLFMELVSYLVDNDSTSPYVKALRNIYYSTTGEVDKLREINERISGKV